jgi:hypothetical protein
MSLAKEGMAHLQQPSENRPPTQSANGSSFEVTNRLVWQIQPPICWINPIPQSRASAIRFNSTVTYQTSVMTVVLMTPPEVLFQEERDVG